MKTPFAGWPYWWVAVGFAALAQGMILMDRTALYPLLPVVGQDLRLSGAQAGAIASTYAVVYVATQIPAGVLGDRLGLKRVLSGTLVLAGLTLLAVALWSRSYTTMLVLMAMHGLGAAGVWPLANSLATDAAPPERRGASISYLYILGSVGMVVGLAVPGLLYVATGYWWTAFLLMGALTLALGLACWGLLRQTPHVVSRGGLGGLRPVLTQRHLILLCLANFLSLYGMWVVFTWAPSYLALERGLGVQWAGVLTALVALTAIPGALMLGRLSDRWGRKRLAVALVAAAAATIAGMASLESPSATVVLLALYGFLGPMALGPAVYAWVVDVVADSHLPVATALATFSAISMVSSFVAPMVSGWLWDVTGSLSVAFYVGAAVVGLGALCMLLPRETVAGRRPAPAPSGLTGAQQTSHAHLERRPGGETD